MLEENVRAFQPLFPWVFVHVLQREQQVGKIIMVEGPKQNKPVYEAVVLKTWQPTTKMIEGKAVDVQSTLKQGDHVVFPHWTGLPVVGYDDKKYRIVKEVGWSISGDGGIFGTIDQDVLLGQAFLDRLQELITPGSTPAQIVEALLEHFVIFDKAKPSVTLSGV